MGGAMASPMIPPDYAPEFLAACGWEGARIVSEMETRRGGKLRETWELSKDGKQLVIRTALPAMGDRPGMEFKRVYDRVGHSLDWWHRLSCL